MKTFYRLKENGEILDFCEFEDDMEVPAFIQEQYQETDRKIVRVYNGALKFEDETNAADFEAPAPTEAEIQAQLTAAVQAYMDSKAQTRGYDNIHTACSYSNSTDHIFAAEGQACLQWRDKVWRKCYDLLAEVMAGTREIPTVEELIAELPVLEW